MRLTTVEKTGRIACCLGLQHGRILKKILDSKKIKVSDWMKQKIEQEFIFMINNEKIGKLLDICVNYAFEKEQENNERFNNK